MKPLTARQKQVLDIIIQFIREYRFPPTLKEITDLLGASSRNTAVKHVQALTKKGYLHWEKNKARSIRILDSGGQESDKTQVSLPLVGSVTAGSPMLSEENIERHITIPRHFIRTLDKHFLLKVQGESMKNAGILENDLVIVRSQTQAGTGDIIVALLGNETTVKRLEKSNGNLYLKAENPAFSDIHPTGEWSIQGRVVGLLREHIT
ncbi:MAG: transcriptional repressor LexA [candidate division KSB1 bacterium]|nr:transcriptional repressor LexA [candidate division KSB1 bacterium]